MSSNEIAGLDWAANRLLPAFQTPQQVDIYDIRGASYEAQLTIATLVGLINRPQPRVYLLVNNEDDFWFKTLFASVQHNYATEKKEDVLAALLAKYGSSVKGLIIYNPSPDAVDSINIATTLSGQRDGIIVSPAQAAALQSSHQLPVLFNLNQFNWKTRLQTYQWAYDNLLKDSSSRLVAGIDPKSLGAIGLRSFLVATRTFVYWLDSRDALPDITNILSSERNLMTQIFSHFPAGATHLGWFIDEGSGVSLTSDAAITVLATDLFSNLETFTGVPANTPATPKAGPAIETPQAANNVYVSFTVSDGDNLQYCQHHMLKLWNDPARGSFPLGWTISPVLIQGTPALASYYMSTAKANDELIAGPSGAGYMFPSRWPTQHLPAFLERTGQLMQEMGLNALEVLDTTTLQASGLPFLSGLRQTGMAFNDEQAQRTFAQALTPYGIHGLLSGSGLANPSWKIVDGMPIYQNLGLASNVTEAVNLITKATASTSQRPLFLNLYILAWSMTPGNIKQVIQQLGNGYEVVTPGTLLTMIRQHGQ
ncbi:MAG TPA: GxGYxYP domain-containing protein [Ktedonobacteraceae bacterium]|nr:GxGYxYP domain-containing protein [Ktedonobacteraceae bacterium]